MANPFDVSPVNPLQALLMQQHGADAAFQQQMRPLQLQEMTGRIRGRDQLSAMLGQGGTPDYDRLALGMLAAGDTATAGVLASLTNQKASRALQERQVALQERQAEEKPQYQIVEDAAGNKQIVKLEPYGRGASVVNPTGMGNAPTNPYSSGKATEAQSKDQLYASRMFEAERILRDTESVGADPVERAKSKVPLIGNYLVSQDMQSLDQAKRNFINAVLRRESGAAIAESEFSNAEKQYFPQPGDSAETIKNKRINRMEAIKGIAGAGGPGYRPPFTFDPAGEMMPNGATGPAPTPMGSVSASPTAQRLASGLQPIQGAAPAPAAQGQGQQGILAQAQDAIRRGADPRAVAQRLLQNNINPDEIGLSWQ